MGWSNTLPFLKYGERFRKHRRMMQQHFNSHAVAAFRPIQTTQVNEFLKRVLVKPDNVIKECHRLIAASILMATFGHEVTSEDDAYISLVKRTTKMSTDAGSPGGTIIDLFPSRQYPSLFSFETHILTYKLYAVRFVPAWFPGMGVKRLALATAKNVAEVMEMPLRELREKRVSFSFPSSFVQSRIPPSDNGPMCVCVSGCRHPTALLRKPAARRV